jgi:hypothetical protein
VLHGGEAVCDARTIPVQGLRPGDHAFAAYGGAETPVQWDMLGAFVRQGLIAGEKVLVLLTPEPYDEDLLDRLHARTPAVERAWQRGQLQLTSMRRLIRPDRRFSAERQWRRLAEETRQAVHEGYPAVRAYIDMAWTADLDTDLDTVLWREREAGHLFDERFYSEVCAYDERAFPADMLGALARAHPRHLLSGVGALRAVHDEAPTSSASTASTTAAGAASAAGAAPCVRMIGEADVRTFREFAQALRSVLFRGVARAAGYITVDLTTLHFLSAGCAAWLLRLCAERSDLLTEGARGDAAGSAGPFGEAAGSAGAAAEERGGTAPAGTGEPRGTETGAAETGTAGARAARGRAAGAPRITLCCTRSQARLLHRLGAPGVRSLTLAVHEGDGC